MHLHSYWESTGFEIEFWPLLGIYFCLMTSPVSWSLVEYDIRCRRGSWCLCGVINKSFSCLCFCLIYMVHPNLASCFLASLVTVCRSLASYNVQCIMRVPVFHLMLTIDMSLLCQFKQSPLNTHNTASPSHNKEDTSWEEGMLHQHPLDFLSLRWPTNVLLDKPWP